MSDEQRPICGGISGELQGEQLQEALDLLDKSLAQLASSNGPSFKLVKVKSVTSQVVAGTLYRLKVQLSQGDDVKESEVQIWHQPWLQEKSINIKINVDGDEQTIEKTF